MTLKVGSDEYKKLLRRYTELEFQRGMSEAEARRHYQIGIQLSAAELAHVADEFDTALKLAGSIT